MRAGKLRAGYQPEIDGIRAIAVLAVVVFHIDPELLPGGFIGVDVFLVISGFLITRIIARERAAGQFSWLEFYRRRILRIAPAYFVLVAVTLLAGCLLMQPQDLRALAASALWSSFSLPNVYFWLSQDVGYFAPASDQIPLLHLWSLGVEEQYYLLWPAVLLCLLRLLSASRAVLVMVAMTAGSFWYAQRMAVLDPSFAYYMLPTRFGELLLGGVLAMTPMGNAAERNGTPRVPAELMALTGFALLGYGMWSLDAEATFPGLNALYPCIGTMLLIMSVVRGGGYLTAVLRWRPVVWVGLISYSLYLWHWPILAFARYFLGAIGPVGGAVCFLAALLFAVASYRYVETPFRYGRTFGRVGWGRALSGYALAIAVSSVAGAALLLTDGLERQLRAMVPAIATESERMHEYTRPAFEYPYNCQRSQLEPALFEAEECVVRPAGAERTAPRVLLAGDSNAAHYIGVIGAIGRQVGFGFRNVSLSACPPLIGASGRYGATDAREQCSRYRSELQRRAADYDIVVLGAYWPVYSRVESFKNDLRRTLRHLTRDGRQVVLLGTVPRFPEFDRNCEIRSTRLPLYSCEERMQRGRRHVAANRVLQSFARSNPNVHYLDIDSVLCPDDRCSAYLDGRPVYFDPGHLSMAGSWDVGARVAAGAWPDVFERAGGGLGSGGD